MSVISRFISRAALRFDGSDVYVLQAIGDGNKSLLPAIVARLRVTDQQQRHSPRI
jgi:hypothetical protein